MSTDRHWKRVEREVAAKMLGQRIPLSGSNNMGKVGDVELELLNTEVKSGKQVPTTVAKWLGTIRDEHEPGKLPVLVMKPYRQQDEIAVMAMDDFGQLVRDLLCWREEALAEHTMEECLAMERRVKAHAQLEAQ